MITNKRNLTYIALLLISASSSLFFYCNSSHDSNHVTGKVYDYNPYFILGENLKWNYINQAPRDESELYNAEIAGITEDNESVTADFKTFPFFNKSKTGCSVRMTKDGNVFVKDSTEDEKLLLPSASKLQKGFSWQYGGWAAGVMDTNVTVKTEKGEYNNCIYVDYSLGGITFSVEVWYAKGAGIVKWGANRTNPPQRVYIYYVLQ